MAKDIFSKLQKNFCLGFVLASLILIFFSQSLAYVGTSPIISSSMLGTIFIGLIIGFILTYYFPIKLKKHTKIVYILTALATSVFMSTLFIKLLWSYWNSALAFGVLLLFAGVSLFSLLGILLAINLNKSKSFLGLSLIMLATGLLAGALLTELVLLNFLGIAWAIVLNTCLLLWCYIFDIEQLSQEIISVSAALAIVVISFGVNTQLNGDDVLHQSYRAINHEYYEPVAPAESFTTSLFTSIPKKLDHEYQYISLLRKILYKELNIKNKDVLILGNGGYQLTRNDTKNLHFTYVNYSDDGRPSACTFMDVMAGGNNIVTKTEKSAWESDKLYDVIVSNIFPRNITIPPALLSYQQMIKVRNALPENGIAIFNVVARPTLTDLYSKRVDNTIRSVFPSCMEIPMTYSNKPTNIIYVCRKSKEETDNTIYTINFNAERKNG